MNRYTRAMSISVRLSVSIFGLALLLLATAAVATDVPENPTYGDVAPILQQSCVSCHQPGQIGPMALRSYDEVRPWAKSIGQKVGEREMPPWHADPGFGPFSNDRSLQPEQIDTIVRWVRQGAPRGELSEPAELPAPSASSASSASSVSSGSGWLLGEPDHVLEFDEIAIAADGPDQFRNFVIPTDFGEDRFITGVEVLPGDKQVVHHVLLWQGVKGGGANPQSLIGGWAAGAVPEMLPAGTGRLLKQGSPLIGDLHYHPIGSATTDKTRVGLHFGENVNKELVNLWIINTDFEIPAGDPSYEARATYTFYQDAHIKSLTPHMHYRGKDFSYTATYPDGRKEELLRVSRYDFNWQTSYDFAEPVAMPAGTRVDCVARWDNSTGNPANPDPTKTVRFGNESFDEMMIGFVDYVVDEGVSPRPRPSPVLDKLTELAAQFPGEVWRVDMMSVPGQGLQPSALHLPAQGDGGWYVEFANIVGKAFVRDIAWNGQAFSAKADIPGQGTLDLSGTADVTAGTIMLKVSNADGQGGEMTGTLAR